jgi:hypothetical protein
VSVGFIALVSPDASSVHKKAPGSASAAIATNGTRGSLSNAR